MHSILLYAAPVRVSTHDNSAGSSKDGGQDGIRSRQGYGHSLIPELYTWMAGKHDGSPVDDAKHILFVCDR